VGVIRVLLKLWALLLRLMVKAVMFLIIKNVLKGSSLAFLVAEV
jgi:hypothetical protein